MGPDTSQIGGADHIRRLLLPHTSHIPPLAHTYGIRSWAAFFTKHIKHNNADSVFDQGAHSPPNSGLSTQCFSAWPGTFETWNAMSSAPTRTNTSSGVVAGYAASVPSSEVPPRTGGLSISISHSESVTLNFTITGGSQAVAPPRCVHPTFFTHPYLGFLFVFWQRTPTQPNPASSCSLWQEPRGGSSNRR